MVNMTKTLLSILIVSSILFSSDTNLNIKLTGEIKEEKEIETTEVEVGVALDFSYAAAIVTEAQGVRLRESSSTKSKTLLYLDFEEILEIISKDDNDWLEVSTYDGITGFVNREYVTLVNDYLFYDRTMADEMIDIAYKYIGTPYVWGGNSLTGGIDCSSFVKQIYATQGIEIPRTAQTISRCGTEVDDRDSLLKGDLLFFGKDTEHITHVAMYIEDNLFIHSGGGIGISISTLEKERYDQTLVIIKRFL